MHRMQGVLAVVPPLHTLLGRGTLVETNKTYEPTNSSAENILASEQNARLSVRCYSCFRLTPISGRCPCGAKQEKREVLLPWGQCLTGSRSLVKLIVSWLSSVSLSIQTLDTQSLNAGAFKPDT